MNNGYKNNIYSELKNRSETLYLYRKKILKLFKTNFYEKISIFNILSNFDRTSVKIFLNEYDKYPQLAELLINNGYRFESKVIQKLLEKYGETLILNCPKYLLAFENLSGKLSDFVDNYNVRFINYAKTYPNEFNLFITNYKYNCEIIKIFLDNDVSEELILQNFDKVIKVKKFLCDLDRFKKIILNKTQYENILKSNVKDIDDMIKIYYKIEKRKEMTTSNSKELLHNYLLKNYNLDNLNFLNEVFKDMEFEYSYAADYFKNTDDIIGITNFAKFLINNDKISIDVKKSNLETLFFKCGVCSFSFKEQIEDMINNKKIPEELTDYIKFYNQLSKCENDEDLNEFIEQVQKFKILKYEEISNIIIVNYNKNLNEKVLNPEKLHESESVEISYVPVQIELNNQIVTKNVKKIKIKNIPFTSVITSIDYKPRNTTLSDEQYNFNDRLVSNPSLWLSNPTHGTKYISMSANKDNYFYTFGDYGQILAGFSKFKDRQITNVFSGDAGTNMMAGTDPTATASNLVDIDSITIHGSGERFGTGATKAHRYNEIVSKREGVVPDYFFTASTSKNNAKIPSSSHENTLKWAAYFDKPIIEIDCASYYKPAIETFYLELKRLHDNPLVPTLEELSKLQKLKLEAETFYDGLFIDLYELIMVVIDMDNRTYTQENILRIQNIFSNTFMQNYINPHEFYKVRETLLDPKQREQIETERKEFVKKIYNDILLKSRELNDKYLYDTEEKSSIVK